MISSHDTAASPANWTAVAADRERVAVVYKDPTRRPEVWDLRAGCVYTLPDTTPHAAKINISPTGRLVALFDANGGTHVYELPAGRLVYTLDREQYGPALRHLDWSPDEAHFLAIGDRSSLGDAASGRRLFDLPTGKVRWSPDGTYLSATEDQRGIRVWEPRLSDRETRIPIGVDSFLVWAGWTRAGPRFTAGYTSDSENNRRWVVWDLKSNAELFSLSGIVGSLGPLNWSPSGDRVVTRLKSGGLRVWDGSNGAELLDLVFADMKDRRWLWSPDGHQFATVGDGGIRILDGRPIPP